MAKKTINTKIEDEIKALIDQFLAAEPLLSEYSSMLNALDDCYVKVEESYSAADAASASLLDSDYEDGYEYDENAYDDNDDDWSEADAESQEADADL